MLAREDFDSDEKLHLLYSYLTGKPVEIYRSETDIPDLRIGGVASNENALIVVDRDNGNDGVWALSLEDGAWAGPVLSQSENDIDALITFPPERFAHGIRVSGPLPSYVLFDQEDNRILAGLQQTFPTSTVTPVSSTPDFEQIVLRVSGNEGARRYLLYDRTEHALEAVAESYPDVAHEEIASISAINFPARDGTKIPAIVTWPLGADTGDARKDLPLLVLPHGGPESYDSVRFDWWTQYFARRGYLVLQPNFRGSTGFGEQFRLAGRGQWGRLMQDDVTDGVQSLIRAGYADPKRVCIMGASYGGYAALAGGAFTPELYRCVISVAGVSDLPRMLADEKAYSGADHWVVSYWEDLIGDSREEREKLREISPFHHATSFRAPVLLLHGDDDTVVPPRQSQRMARALRRAGREVEYVELDGEDHWLSRNETRLTMLREISRFLDRHNPIVVSASETGP